MAIFSRLHEKDEPLVSALRSGNATEDEQKLAAELIIREMARADTNAEEIKNVRQFSKGLERAIEITKR